MRKLRLVLRREKMSKDEIIAELVELVLMQEKELTKLHKKIEMINQYLEVYEDYVKGG